MRFSKRALSLVLTLAMLLSMFAFTMPAMAAEDAPDMPLNVIYNPVTEDSVTISWDAVEGATGYNIYRRDSKSSDAELIGTVASVGWFDDTVVPGTDYWYSVSAINADSESDATKEAFIALANDDALEIGRFKTFTTGSRLRLGDLDGDGRTDILVCNTTSQSNYTLNGSVMYALVAYDLEGNVMWSFSLDPNFKMIGSGVTSSSADEPVNIADLDGDGYNEVAAVCHPKDNRGGDYTGGVFLILDGRTGKIMKDASGNDCRKNIADLNVPGLSSTGSGIGSVNSLGDCVIFANFDGRKINGKSVRQHVVLKSRYENETAFEMFDKDGNFVMKYMWRHSARATGQTQSLAGHTGLAVDLDGDGIDEFVSNYSVYKVDTENNTLFTWWWIKTNVEKRSGQPGDPLNDPTPMNYTGTTTRIQTAGHVDTIQVGYMFGDDGPLCVLFGGGGPDGGSDSFLTSSTFCYTWDGVFQWVSNTAIEPQSLNLAQFRTDAPGLTTWGLDRRTRSSPSVTSGSYGKDAMFLIGTDGAGLFLEYPFVQGSIIGNPMGWSSIVIRVDNWTGTYSPLTFSFNRNTESRRAARYGHYPQNADTRHVKSDGAYQAAELTPNSFANWVRDYREPALYDGYANTLFQMPVPDTDRKYMFEFDVDWRYMAMDLCGDARTELLAYDDAGNILIYYNNANGDIRINEDGTPNDDDCLDVLRSGITGEPKQQTTFMSNYSRYPTDVYYNDITGRTPAQPQVELQADGTALVSWTPIINATSYTLYRNGEKVDDFTGATYVDENLAPNSTYSYTVTASNAKGTSQEALPIEITTAPTIKLSGDVGAMQGEDLKYTVSVANMNKLATATLWFEVEDAYFSGKSYAGLNGFELLDNILWTQEGDKWIGRATITNLDGGVTTLKSLDIFEMVLTAKEEIGDTAVKLTKFLLSGYDAENVAVYLEAEVLNDSVSVTIDEFFGKYDVNRDKVVNQLDLTTAQLYYQSAKGDDNWNLAQRADVNGDDIVDLNDLILILNNIVW